jgi:hypothetical protein
VIPRCQHCLDPVEVGEALCVRCGSRAASPGHKVRKKCPLGRFHKAHVWEAAGGFGQPREVWCSGRGFRSIQEVEEYLAPPWLIDQVEDFLAS